MADRKKRDKQQSIHSILNAAKRLFSKKGLYGTSIRDIEEASGISKGLIMHHFDTKERLYIEVQDLLTKEYISMMAKQRQDISDLKKLIKSSIKNSLLYNKKNHEYYRIALWSYLEGLERIIELERRFTSNLIDAMKEGRKKGLIRKDIDPFFMPFIIRGTINYWIQKEKLVKELSDKYDKKKIINDENMIDALYRVFLE